MAWDEGAEPVKCSADGNDVLGSGVFVTTHEKDETPLELQTDMYLYQSTKGSFLVLHPKCFHDMVDEMLRAETQALLVFSVGKISDLREALQM